MSFTFNGVNCESLGMVVERYPFRPFPTRKQTIYSVPGRSGDLIIDEDAYENTTQEYEVYVGHDSETMQEKLTAIAAWLLTPSGYCVLTDTYDPAVKRYARFIGGVNFMNSLNKFGKATATFSCKPQRYPATDVVYSGTLSDISPVTITLPTSGRLPSYPLLEITGAGANTSFRITTGALTIAVPARSYSIAKIIVDWELNAIYDASDNTVPHYTSVSGTWTKMGDGDSITITEETNPDISYRFYPRQYSL